MNIIKQIYCEICAFIILKWINIYELIKECDTDEKFAKIEKYSKYITFKYSQKRNIHRRNLLEHACIVNATKFAPKIVKLLIDVGVDTDVNICNICVINRSEFAPKIIKLLIDAGVYVGQSRMFGGYQRIYDGNSLLYHVCCNGGDKYKLEKINILVDAESRFGYAYETELIIDNCYDYYIIEKLFEIDTYINFNETYALQKIISNKNFDFAKKIIDKNIISKRKIEMTLYECVKHNIFMRDDFYDIFGDINYNKDTGGNTMLHLICNNIFTAGVIGLIKKIINCGVNSINYKRKSPLMFVCANNFSEFAPSIVQLLIDNGADPNIQDRNGRTAFIELCRRNNTKFAYDIAKILVDAGANVNLKDNKGNNAMIYILLKHQRNSTLKDIIINFMPIFDINLMNNKGNSILHYFENSRLYFNEEITQLFIRNGMEITCDIIRKYPKIIIQVIQEKDDEIDELEKALFFAPLGDEYEKAKEEFEEYVQK